MQKEYVLINYTGRKGGGNLDAIESAKGLLQNGENVIAIVSSYAENIEDWRELGLSKLIEIKTYTGHIDFIFSLVKFLTFGKNFIKKQLTGYKIKYIYSPMTALWTVYINELFPKVPKFTVIHDAEPHSGEHYHKFFRDVYSRSDVLFVHSKQFVKMVQEKYHKPAYYIPLGRHDCYAAGSPKKNMVSYDPSKINFLFFGRISKYKGLNVLAEAFEKLSQKRKDCALYVIGNGAFEPYKEKYNSLPNCQVINRWIGDDEVAGIFTGKNLVCILPYLDASQSGVALVAMDFGVPVIATATGGLTEQVCNEETGLLIEPNDVDELEKAMERVADNKELYKKLAAGGQTYARSLSWDNTMEKVEKIYEERYRA